MGYRTRLDDVVASLRANPRIEVLRYEVSPPADNSRLAALVSSLRAKRSVEVPQALIDLYLETDGFTLSWEPRREVLANGRPWTYPPCHSVLLPSESLGCDRHDEIWAGEDAPPFSFAALFALDHDQEEDGAWLVRSGESTGLCLVHDQGEDVDRLALDFDAFFDQWCRWKGFFSWQRLMLRDDEHAARWWPAIFDGL